MRALRLLLLAVAAILLSGEGPLAERDFLLRMRLTLPPAGDWVRVDLPPVVHSYLVSGFDDLRVVDANGVEVERMVLADLGFFEGQSAELSVYRRDALDEGRARVGVVLPGPGAAPTHLRLTGAKRALEPLPVSISVAVDAEDTFTPLAIGQPVEDGDDLIVELPALVGRLLSIEGPSVKTIVAEWRPARGPGADPIEPRLVAARDDGRAMEFMLDLRTRFAPGLRLRVDMDGFANGDLEAVDSGSHESVQWRPLFVAPGVDVPEGRVQATITAPGERASRWVRLIVPTDEPDSVVLGDVDATIRRHRLFVRRAGLTGPLTVLAGLRDLGEPTGHLRRAAASWDAGVPGTLDLVPNWAPAIGPGNRPAIAAARRPKGESVPWAAIVFTFLSLVFVVLAFTMGAKPDEVLDEKS